MEQETIKLNTLIVGTGAAGYNAALRLKQFGVTDIAIVTEGIQVGTSRNTGSDKQTYYKLGLAGDSRDSVAAMARDLFSGGCVDGDHALIEAALSARSFLHLCERGVPFPTNRYGEYVGYKTDHDPCARATSAGPLTSKLMTEALEKAVSKEQIKIYDRMLVVSIIKDGARAVGALALDLAADEPKFCLFHCRNIIFATGGPGGIYADSVYPLGHNGANGILFEAGVKGQNLTQWQYGMASLRPRWNVSGTYMQVLPRFVSVDENGTEYEFLNEAFPSESECLSSVFLKGYQWPFDSRKAQNGSSVIDLLVYRETVLRGRRVYLDYTQNPNRRETLDFSALSEEAREYLKKANACFGMPIQRLAHMNAPAIELYRSKGVDLYHEKLEIAVCAQHNNGGAKVDAWWQTDIRNLFVCGEAAGTHGIFRPGGSALNAGQVGSLRAATYIAAKEQGEPIDTDTFRNLAEPILNRHRIFCETVFRNPNNVKERTAQAKKRMSASGGVLRKKETILSALQEISNECSALDRICGCENIRGLAQIYRLRDILIAQQMYLSAMRDHLCHYGKTCGSALYYDANGSLPNGLEETFRFTADHGEINGFVQETVYGEPCRSVFRPVRPLPEGGGFFENVWKQFRENGNVE